MAYLENQRIELEIEDVTVIVTCDIDWNGRVSNSEVHHFDTINDLPTIWLDRSTKEKIEREILIHEYKVQEISREFQTGVFVNDTDDEFDEWFQNQ